MKYWLLLGVAIVLETIATTMLKLSEGFSKPLYAFGSILIFCAIFYMLSIIFNHIPVGVTYAIWSGLGIVLISIISWLFLNQKLDLAAIIGIAFIVIGVVIMQLFSKSTAH